MTDRASAEGLHPECAKRGYHRDGCDVQPAPSEGLRALADRWEAEGQRRDADPTRHHDPVNVLAAGIYHEHAETLRAALRDTGGIDEDVLRQMVERPMTSAYFEDFNAGRLDSEQVARALAGDYARLSTPRTETSDD